LALVKCSCNNRLTMLMKLAIENTEMDRDVSLRIASRGCVKWYRKVNVLAIAIQAGNKSLGSSDPPDRYRTQDVMYALTELMVRRRTRVACGV